MDGCIDRWIDEFLEKKFWFPPKSTIPSCTLYVVAWKMWPRHVWGILRIDEQTLCLCCHKRGRGICEVAWPRRHPSGPTSRTAWLFQQQAKSDKKNIVFFVSKGFTDKLEKDTNRLSLENTIKIIVVLSLRHVKTTLWHTVRQLTSSLTLLRSNTHTSKNRDHQIQLFSMISLCSARRNRHEAPVWRHSWWGFCVIKAYSSLRRGRAILHTFHMSRSKCILCAFQKWGREKTKHCSIYSHACTRQGRKAGEEDLPAVDGKKGVRRIGC